MGSPSKENNVLKLILENSPLKEWHFEEILKESKATRAATNKWLKKYVSEGLITRVKEKGKFPYFTAGNNNPNYYSMKKIYALEQLHKSGLISELISQKNSKTIIIFGSMIKGDWYKGSDIDIFVLGNLTDFDKKIYEFKLNTHIELHMFQNKKGIKEVKTGLMKNVINGYIIKGQIQDIAEVI